MLSSKHISKAGLALFLARLVNGQIFTLDCAPLIVERGDPILHPGVISNDSHVHTVVGGTGFNISMTNAQAVASDNTTCSRQLDHSNYWQPGLYYQESANSFVAMEFEGSAIYYFNRACDYAPGQTACPDGFKSAAPPVGLRIITGNSTFRTYNPPNAPRFAQEGIQTTCLTDTDYSPTYPGLPTRACRRLRAETFFPSCWDGVNVDSEDHFSHMAFPVQSYNGGVCPQSHPKAIYSVFYQFFYNTEPFPNWQNWLYAMGDPTGYGLHGDLLVGWTNQTALEEAINTCTGANGADVAPCSVADQGGQALSIPPTVPGQTEQIGFNGPVPALPGYHPLTGSYTDRITPQGE